LFDNKTHLEKLVPAFAVVYHSQLIPAQLVMQIVVPALGW
jgi:hypothetical protein